MALLAGAIARGPVDNNDIGFHLRIGEQILAGRWPSSADFLSTTARGVFYPNHEWLAQVIFALTARLGGEGALAALQGLLVGGALFAVGWSVRAPSGLRLGAMAFVFALGEHHILIRPHLFGWLAAAILAGLILRKRWRLAVALVWLWANLHASVLLGLVMLSLGCAQDFLQGKSDPNQPRQAWKILRFPLFAGLAVLLTPHHFHLFHLPFRITGAADFVGEWKPFTTSEFRFYLQLAFAALVALALLVRGKPAWPFEAAGAVSLVALTFSASRHGVVSCILLAPWLSTAFARHMARVRSLGGIVAGLAVATLLAWGRQRVFEERKWASDVDRYLLPLAAIEFLKKYDVPGPIFNDYNFGGTFLWKAPEYPVFIDGRLEVYAGAPLVEYLTVSRAEPGWQHILSERGIRTVVVRAERALVPALVSEPGWELLYFDYNSVIFTRAERAPKARRLDVITPIGHRDRARVHGALADLDYLLKENPDYFGGYKVRAFVNARVGNLRQAADDLQQYFARRPDDDAGLSDAGPLIERLERANLWPPRGSSHVPGERRGAP